MSNFSPALLAGLTLACGFRPAAVQAVANDPAAAADPFTTGWVTILVPVPAGCLDAVQADPQLAAHLAAGAVLVMAFEDAADLPNAEPRQ